MELPNDSEVMDYVGDCEDLSRNTIHTHKWAQHPPNNFLMKRRVGHLGEEISTDADWFSDYDYWLSAEGKLQMETEQTVEAVVCEWCQFCYKTRIVDWVPEPRKVTTPKLKENSDSKDMVAWLEELRIKVEGEEGCLEHEAVKDGNLRPVVVSPEPETAVEVSCEPAAKGEGSLEPKTVEEGNLDPEIVVMDSLEPETGMGCSLEPETAGEGSPKQETARRRKGGKRSRMRRLLEYQLKLSVDKGLPLSRLLTQGTKARSPRLRGRREQEESASPFLRKRLEVEERGQEGESPGMRDDGEGKVRREEVGDTGELYSSQTKLFMLNSTPTSHHTLPSQATPPHHTFPQNWGSPPFPNLKPPYTPQQILQCGPMPGSPVFCIGCQSWNTIVTAWG